MIVKYPSGDSLGLMMRIIFLFGLIVREMMIQELIVENGRTWDVDQLSHFLTPDDVSRVL